MHVIRNKDAFFARVKTYF